jgi:hypothetical protein
LLVLLLDWDVELDLADVIELVIGSNFDAET